MKDKYYVPTPDDIWHGSKVFVRWPVDGKMSDWQEKLIDGNTEGIDKNTISVSLASDMASNASESFPQIRAVNIKTVYMI